VTIAMATFVEALNLLESTMCAALEQARLTLQYTKIVGPVSGVVNKNVLAGMNVQPSQQLLTIIPLDHVWITANFKKRSSGARDPGRKWKWTRVGTGARTGARLTVLPEPPARSSAYSRPKMPPAAT
jgi:membrane fusion protein, multidrug efflux system